MLAKNRIDDDDQDAEEEAEKAADSRSAVEIGRLISSEQRLYPRQESTDRNGRGEEARGKCCPFQDDAGDGDDRIHTPSFSVPDAQVARQTQILYVDKVTKHARIEVRLRP